MSQNKTDPFVGFDPTEIQGQGCCGEKVYDFQTGAWVVKPKVKTCEEKLEDAVADKAKAEQAKTQAEQERDTAQAEKAQADTAKAQAETERDEALAKLRECEQSKPQCDAEPVYSIGDVRLFDAYTCGAEVSSLGGETFGTGVTDANATTSGVVV